MIENTGLVPGPRPCPTLVELQRPVQRAQRGMEHGAFADEAKFIITQRRNRRERRASGAP